MLIAVDFDGTLNQNHMFPEIGEPRTWLIELIKKWQRGGDKLILWTCREDVLPHERAVFSPRLYLTEAVEWCKSYGLEFDAINKQLYESTDPNFKVSRKIFADLYIDDKSVIFHDDSEQLIFNKNNKVETLS